MKPIYNNYLIKPVINDNPLNLIGFNGEPLIVSPRFEPLRHTPQFGEIVEHPLDSDGKHELLPIGTKVFFHYVVCEESKKITLDKKEFYLCPTDLVWGKIKNPIHKNDTIDMIVVTEDIVICELIMDNKLKDGDIFIKDEPTRELNKLRVVGNQVFDSKKEIFLFTDNVSLNYGNEVYTVKNAGMPIPNSDLVFIKKGNILAIQRENKIIPVKGKHLILEDEVPDVTIWKGLMVADMHRCKFQTGTYLGGERREMIDKVVTYIHGMSTKLEVNGIKYAVVTNKDLIFLN